MKKFDKYIIEVKEQLCCNTTKEYSDNNVTYLYTDEEIDNNLDYFKKCMKNDLSTYKALLFFYDYLNEDI